MASQDGRVDDAREVRQVFVDQRELGVGVLFYPTEVLLGINRCGLCDEFDGRDHLITHRSFSDSEDIHHLLLAFLGDIGLVEHRAEAVPDVGS